MSMNAGRTYAEKLGLVLKDQSKPNSKRNPYVRITQFAPPKEIKNSNIQPPEEKAKAEQIKPKPGCPANLYRRAKQRSYY